MKKRLVSLLLAVVLVLGLMPTALAASYNFDPGATIFTQNFTTEMPRPNDLSDYFTVESTPLAPSKGTTTWNTGINGTNVNVFNWNGDLKYGNTHAILTFTFKKDCNFWVKYTLSLKSGSNYVEFLHNDVSTYKQPPALNPIKYIHET